MTQLDRVQLDGKTYNIAASPNSTNEFTSNDSADSSAKGWTSVNTLSSGETNKSIFNKISSMFKNIRYLYNCLGRGIFNDTNTVAKALDTKASASHKHGISDIPTSNTQTNSSSFVPTSALVYSMNEILKSLNSANADRHKIDGFDGSSEKLYWVNRSSNDPDGSYLRKGLDELYNKMNNNECIRINFESYPYISGGTFTGIMFRREALYGTVFGVNHFGESIVITRYNNIWGEPIRLANKSDLNNKANKSDLDSKANKSDLDSKANKSDLNNKANKSDLEKIIATHYDSSQKMPNDYKQGYTCEHASCSNHNIPWSYIQSNYCIIVTYNGWSDNSGAPIFQMAYTSTVQAGKIPTIAYRVGDVNLNKWYDWNFPCNSRNVKDYNLIANYIGDIGIPRDTDGSKTNAKFDDVFNKLKDGESVKISFSSFPYISGYRFSGTMYKSEALYGYILACNHGGESILIHKYNGTWSKPLFLNPLSGTSFPSNVCAGQIFFKKK